jgi:hypothetical protein
MTEEQNSYSAPEATDAPRPQETASYEATSNETASNEAGNPATPGYAAEPGQGRRRRRRKRKGTRAGQQNGQPQAQNGQPQNVQVQNPSQNQPQNNSMQNGQPQNQRSGKRFFRKNRNQQNGQGGVNPNPGNGNGGGQGRRRQGGKQRRQPAAFVGPMDHSYRTANGNISDGPPSTIQLQNGNAYGNGYSSHGNGNGNVNGNANGNGVGYGQAYPAEAAAVPIREDAPTRIYCYIEDLFFLAKINETARKLGIKVEFVKGERDLLAELLEMPEEARPGLIVFDLNNVNAKPLTLIPKLRSKLKKSTSIIGFVSHLQGDLKMRATEAGCDTVMPRSAFSQNLPNLLRRYGLEEVEEDETQPNLN